MGLDLPFPESGKLSLKERTYLMYQRNIPRQKRDGGTCYGLIFPKKSRLYLSKRGRLLKTVLFMIFDMVIKEGSFTGFSLALQAWEIETVLQHLNALIETNRKVR